MINFFYSIQLISKYAGLIFLNNNIILFEYNFGSLTPIPSIVVSIIKLLFNNKNNVGQKKKYQAKIKNHKFILNGYLLLIIYKIKELIYYSYTI